MGGGGGRGVGREPSSDPGTGEKEREGGRGWMNACLSPPFFVAPAIKVFCSLGNRVMFAQENLCVEEESFVTLSCSFSGV